MPEIEKESRFKSGWVEKTYLIDDRDVMIDINPDGTIADIYAYTDEKPLLKDRDGKIYKVKWVRSKVNKLFIHIDPDRLQEVYWFLVDNDYIHDDE